jgi:hypothetical protein
MIVISEIDAMNVEATVSLSELRDKIGSEINKAESEAISALLNISDTIINISLDDITNEQSRLVQKKSLDYGHQIHSNSFTKTVKRWKVNRCPRESICGSISCLELHHPTEHQNLT